MKDFLKLVLCIVISIALVYGIYWCFKTISYNLFEDMVRETIAEMVKPENLKNDRLK